MKRRSAYRSRCASQVASGRSVSSASACWSPQPGSRCCFQATVRRSQRRCRPRHGHTLGLTAEQLPEQPPTMSTRCGWYRQYAATLEQVGRAARRRARRSAAIPTHWHSSHTRSLPLDRDIIVMSVRLVGGLAASRRPARRQSDRSERALFAKAVALGERHDRPVPLLIVRPQRLRRDGHRGAGSASPTSSSASRRRQCRSAGRLLRRAWERADTGDLSGVRLVVHHRSGRTDTFPPWVRTRPNFSRLRSFIRVARRRQGRRSNTAPSRRRSRSPTYGEQLNGPERDDVLPGDSRQWRIPAMNLLLSFAPATIARLRDVIRNRPAEHVARDACRSPASKSGARLRLLPRKDAAAAFNIRNSRGSPCSRRWRRKTSPRCSIEMAPTTARCSWRNCLPRHVSCSLLTPEERAIASTLLGYPKVPSGV